MVQLRVSKTFQDLPVDIRQHIFDMVLEAISPRRDLRVFTSHEEQRAATVTWDSTTFSSCEVTSLISICKQWRQEML